jgi:peptidoglycan/LPS O-acetylase OafA/YrhL
MAEHRLITAYRDDLLAQLPAHLADEVSDGLADAQEKYIGQGLNPDQAASAAIAEFGNARMVVDGFRRACPAWRAARALIVTGPVVGGWWAAALIADRAWDWPIPMAVRLLLGMMLAGSVLLLVASARARRYQQVRRAGLAGCLGLAVLDACVITTAVLLGPNLRWLLEVAVCVSAVRLTFVVGGLRRLVSQPGV